MATVNISKRFQQLLPKVVRFRGQVVEIDAVLNRVRVQHGKNIEWVSSSLVVSIDDYVLVVDGMVSLTLPDLPYAVVEID